MKSVPFFFFSEDGEWKRLYLVKLYALHDTPGYDPTVSKCGLVPSKCCGALRVHLQLH